jgi:sialic acid synthase SpsE
MRIGPYDLDREVLVIAEIGNNHEGDFALAEAMIARAAEAGAGAVKFQTIVPDRLVSPADENRIRQLSRFQLRYDQFEQLARTAARHDLLFLSTPFDLESARFLAPLVPAFKIASGDNNFLPLIETVARTGKPILLSTGLMNLAEAAGTRDFIRGIWREAGIQQNLALLHCVVNYPTSPENAHLAAIRSLCSLGVTVGYSDHTLGIEAAVLAVALGARIIEKHFTLDKSHSDFRDHQLSADPAELKELVQRVREAETLLGEGEKRLLASEEEMAPRVRRSIVAAGDLQAGAILTREDLTWVRPGGGLAPGQEGELLGMRLTRPVSRGERILPQDCR